MPLYSFECSQGHQYDEVLKLEDYQRKTKCPTCKRVGKKVISVAQKEPTFSDKIFPYYDRALNRVFQNRSDRSSFLKKRNLSGDAGGTMSRRQEREMLSKWRVGGFDPRIARHALRD